MPQFDRIVIVDWSAANSPKLGKDSIWIADTCLPNDPPVNHPTRYAAMDAVRSIIQACLDKNSRLFIGFDFGFGYSAGAAEKIAGKANWEALWEKLAAMITDNAENGSNRFEVAAKLNEEAFPCEEGPFWGVTGKQSERFPHLKPTKPPAYTQIAERRIAECQVKSAQPMWKMAYTGSVGSQSLLGIAHLQALRCQFKESVSIWPYETQFDETLDRPVTIAEVYPSFFKIDETLHPIKDAAQVMSVADLFSRLDAEDKFSTLLADPGLEPEMRETILREEGWVVGVQVS